ncbi:MAG: GNAT family N-acetyltransferase [Candidatus Thorarchaeota archaeon]|nr:GNAT family N-acetyltransferase [Candidatus Thorarchaeota archaeon]
MKRIWTWMWDSEKYLLDTLTHVGFVEKERQGLFSLSITKVKPKVHDSAIKLQSISAGITIADFVKANREAFKDDTSRPLEENELEEWLEKSEGFLAECQLAAVIDETIVGTVMSEVITNPINDANHREAWIYGLGALEQYRRQGIASLLVSELTTRLSKQGVKKIWLFTDIEGPIRSFYEHAGFVHEADWVDLDLVIDE